MAMQDKIIAGIILVHSAFGIFWTFLVASRTGFPSVFLATNLALAAMGLVAGVGLLKRRRWAIYLAIGFFLVQFVHVFTPTFQWSFTLGVNLNVQLGWLSNGELGFNVFALIMLAWLAARTFALDHSSQPTPLRGDSTQR